MTESAQTELEENPDVSQIQPELEKVSQVDKDKRMKQQLKVSHSQQLKVSRSRHHDPVNIMFQDPSPVIFRNSPLRFKSSWRRNASNLNTVNIS